MMTRKHFVALAAALAECRADMPAAAFAGLVASVADVCKGANGNFDRGRFLAACEAVSKPAVKCPLCRAGERHLACR